MTHEPECLEVGYELDPSEFCSICITARAAYQRGREDAAHAVEAARDAKTYVYSDAWEAWDEAIAAARGDGEQR